MTTPPHPNPAADALSQGEKQTRNEATAPEAAQWLKDPTHRTRPLNPLQEFLRACYINLGLGDPYAKGSDLNP